MGPAVSCMGNAVGTSDFICHSGAASKTAALVILLAGQLRRPTFRTGRRKSRPSPPPPQQQVGTFAVAASSVLAQGDWGSS